MKFDSADLLSKSNLLAILLVDIIGHAPTAIGILFLITYFDSLTSSVRKWFQSEKTVQQLFQESLQGNVYKGDGKGCTLVKESSITLTIDTSDQDNYLGQALLDHITNHQNTQHIAFKQRSFLLNQKEPVELDKDIYAQPIEEEAAVTGGRRGQGQGPGQEQVIEIFSYHRSAVQLRDWLDHVKRHYMAQMKNKLGKGRYYFSSVPISAPLTMDGKKDLTRLPNQFTFTMKPFHTNRRFTNLFGEEIEQIRERVKHFVEHRDWYDEKGIPYTLGILLSGVPGTGKTSTIKCLANETNRHIFSVTMSSDMTKLQLENLFYNENVVIVSENQTQTICIPLDQRLYVLEDIDAQQGNVLLSRKQPSMETVPRLLEKRCNMSMNQDIGANLQVDLSFLLNLLDGVLENPGRLLVMTSNHPERLDSALIRPGRIDIVSCFKPCSQKTIRQMIEFFYDIQLDVDRVDALQEIRGLTPAQVYRILFQHFGSIDVALEQLQKESLQCIESKRSIESFESFAKDKEEFKETISDEDEQFLDDDLDVLQIRSANPPLWSATNDSYSREMLYSYH